MTVDVRPRHDVRPLATASDVARAAREEVVRAATAAIAARGRFRIGLAGGSTPKALYAAMQPKDLDWTKVEVFFGDERCVGPDRAESNFKMAHDALLSRVPVPPERVHRIRGEAETADGAASEYEAAMRAAFGEGEGEPRFDLLLLGLGADGHTASLFPGSAALEETSRWVVANWVQRLSRTRITLTFPAINRAELVLFLVAGDEKAEAARRAIEGALAGIDVPARRVDPPEGRVVWLLDKLAASRLTPKPPI